VALVLRRAIRALARDAWGCVCPALGAERECTLDKLARLVQFSPSFGDTWSEATTKWRNRREMMLMTKSNFAYRAIISTVAA
jgi:hypothetical protein